MDWMGWKSALFVAVLWPGLLAAAPGPDLEREVRLVEQIADAILDGETMELESEDGQRFFAIYTEQSTDSKAKGTAVILHGRGFHPDWTTVIHPLRVQLPEHGWNTLSVQLPVLDKAATYYDYVPVFPFAASRIDAAIAEVRSRDKGPILVIAHSCGYHMAQHWVEEGGTQAIESMDGFIGIGMGATDYGQRMVTPFVLDKLTVPTLDVFGSRDFPAVKRLASTRLAQMRAAGHPHNAQVIVPGADHYFHGRQDELVQTVLRWLEAF